MVFCLDSYKLTKSENKVQLSAYKGIFKETFCSERETGLIKPVGKWLCSLPKDVWGE
jgi:hypothetical protein